VEQVSPDLIVSDTLCQLWRHIQGLQEWLLDNEGILPRLATSAPEITQGCEGNGGAASGSSGEGSADVERLGRVYLPGLKHLGNHSLSVLDDGADGNSMPVETRSEGGNLDAYALKEASLPTICPQSQVHVHDLLFEARKKCGEVADLSFLAATGSLSKLYGEGIRILSLYEVLVFMYNWHIDAAGHGYDQLSLTPEGWRVQALGSDSPPRSPLGSVTGELNSTSGVPSVSAVPGDGGSDPEKASPDGIGVQGGMGFLRGLLVVAVGSRNGKPPCLPSLVLQRVSSDPFRHMIAGLRRYAKVKTISFTRSVSMKVGSSTACSLH